MPAMHPAPLGEDRADLERQQSADDPFHTRQRFADAGWIANLASIELHPSLALP